jgi:hypothetical protein
MSRSCTKPIAECCNLTSTQTAEPFSRRNFQLIEDARNFYRTDSTDTSEKLGDAKARLGGIRFLPCLKGDRERGSLPGPDRALDRSTRTPSFNGDQRRFTGISH